MAASPKFLKPPKRPFKICNSERNEKKGIACSTLKELKSISRQRLSLNGDCRVFLESDGTEVDDEDYFQFLPPQTLFMVTDINTDWVKPASESLGLQSSSNNQSESLESQDTVDSGVTQLSLSLLHRIIEDPMFFVSLSTEELHTVVDLGVDTLQNVLRCTEAKAMFYQESSQQELDRRNELKETTELLRICQKAISKRIETGDEEQSSKKQKIEQNH